MLDKLSQLWRRLIFYARRDRFDRELEEEMRFHLEMKSEENRQAGMEPLEARYAAERQFGNQTSLREVSREMWGIGSIETIFQDLRYGARMLLKNRGVTLIAVLSLALGIGVNTALFTMFHLFDRPLPLKKPGTVVSLEIHEKDGAGYFSTSFLEYLHLRSHTKVFSELAASHYRPVVLANQGAAETPQEVPAEFVSDNFFSVFETNFI